MARLVVVTSKFLGVAGLGLLSSSALTISYTVFPSLLSLPSPSDAVPVFYKLKQHVAAAHHLLAIATGIFTTTAYVASPRFARHPFLIYMGLSAGAGLFGIPKLMKARDLDCLDELKIAEEGRGRTGSSLRINGEIVKEAVESLQRSLRWQSLLWGVGWAVGTVGLWGDGY